jgi:class 3 adenylate cyclase
MGFPEVEVRQPGRRPLRLVLTEGLELGRECDGLLLADPGVSRRHARLEPRDGEVLIEDLGSTNGTMVGGELVTEPTPLPPDGVAVLGGTEIVVVGTGPPAVAAVPVADPGATVAGAAAWRDQLRGHEPDPAHSSIVQLADLVHAGRPPATARDGGDGDTITIAFSDIESSTEHALRLGDGRWYDVLAIHNGIVRSNLLRHGGREVKSQGDGFMLTFPSARRGLQFAIDVQRAMTRWSGEHPEEGVRIRMGLHTGEALVSPDGDLFGKHVIVAARVANLAAGGEVLVSGVTREIASNRSDLAFDEGRTVALKGIDGPYAVFALDWA